MDRIGPEGGGVARTSGRIRTGSAIRTWICPSEDSAVGVAAAAMSTSTMNLQARVLEFQRGMELSCSEADEQETVEETKTFRLGSVHLPLKTLFEQSISFELYCIE